MKIRRFIVEYLNFNKSQKIGLIALLIILIAVKIIPEFVFKYKADLIKIDDILFDTLSEKNDLIKTKKHLTKEKEINIAPFYFDPNTVKAIDLKKFGLPEYVISNFEKFRKSGAKFKSANDFQKIYGLKQDMFERIKPYLKIDSSKYITDNSRNRKWNIPIKNKVEINKADSFELVKLKGIGPYWASKIIKYRNALGGYYSKTQLYEIYNIKKETVDLLISEICCDSTLIVKLNINTSNLDVLNNHPYLNLKESTAIINYRKQHGLYKYIDDLKKIILLKQETITKIEPYIEF